MSSDPRPDRGRRPWSLRGRLLAQVLGLLTVVLVVIGVVTEFALYGFLVGKLDTELRAAHDRGRAAAIRPRAGEDPARFLTTPGQMIGTMAVRLRDGEVRFAGVLRGPDSVESLNQREEAILLRQPSGRRPRTRAVGRFGDYRLLVTGQRGNEWVVGLPMAPVRQTLWQVGFVFGGVSLTGLFAAGAVAAWTVRRTLRPLHRVAETAATVSELPLDRGEVSIPVRVPEVDTDPRTEVGTVGAALNRMLGHVDAALDARQRSESRVRRFVSDASHELRTPLTAIRGYAELIGDQADTLPAEVAQANQRVQAAAERMTALVEDLLLLARLDENAPAHREPVDLARVVSDAVADARVAAPGHHWRLTAPAEPVIVAGDSGQLHQVVANLLTNAHTHTPAGTTVDTELSIVDSSVRLAVTDDGPGISPDLLPDVFDRFARADASRGRSGHGRSTGLGLAIVAAVVAAHQGTVTADSHPGHTRFTVTLPVGSAAMDANMR